MVSGAFGELTLSLTKDRVIVGIKDNSTRQKLLSEKGLLLEKCMEIARSYEATRHRMKTMQENEKDTVNRIQKFNKKGNRNKSCQAQSPLNAKSKRKGPSPSKTCYFCGRDYHQRQLCPAKIALCNNCNKKGISKQYVSFQKQFVKLTRTNQI